MNKSFIVALLVLSLACSNALFLKKPTKSTYHVFEKLQELEKLSFGKNIMDTIALQIKNKSPLGDIAKMLSEVKQDMVIQQKQDDQLHAHREEECANEIAEYERRIDVATKEQAESEAAITLLKGEIQQAEGEQKNKSQQLEILNNREAAVRTQRLRDAEEFAARQAKSQEVMEALDLILEKLNGLGGGSQQGNEEALVQLAKIGRSNPIMALVQIASTFSEEALNNVITKIEELKVDLEAAIEEDKAQEQEAIAEFNILIAEIEETQKALQGALAELETRLAQARGALDVQQKKLAEAVTELKEAQDGRVAKIDLCEQWRVKYEADKAQRAKEIEVVKEVENIIATKLETMKEYINDREE